MLSGFYPAALAVERLMPRHVQFVVAFFLQVWSEPS